MSTIKLTTLTPIHIGSGNLLQYNTDFVTTQSSEGTFIRIIDDRKILNLIGTEHINDWILSIERKENTKELVKRYAPNANVADYSRRRLVNYVTEIRNTDTLKETIHNGLGRAYIPGSSIKGAIRTAVVSTLSGNLKSIESKIKTGKTDWNGNALLAASEVEKDLLGRNVNDDLFRFVQIGDAHFEENVEIATKMVNLNIRQTQGIWDESKPQIIEAIKNDESAEFQIKIQTKHHELASQQRFHNDKFQVKKLYEEMSSLVNLFKTINNHTRILLEEESVLWAEYDQHDEVADYLVLIGELLDAVNECKEGKECVLRIGHGAGWRFITGAWTEHLEDKFDSLIPPVARPNNHKYSEYVFPKTRRLDCDGDALGFVKLSLV